LATLDVRQDWSGPLTCGQTPRPAVCWTARTALGTSPQAANTGLAALLDLGILHETTGRRWGRSFQAPEVLAVLEGSPRTGP
jgi:hypothetical protein